MTNNDWDCEGETIGTVREAKGWFDEVQEHDEMSERMELVRGGQDIDGATEGFEELYNSNTSRGKRMLNPQNFN